MPFCGCDDALFSKEDSNKKPAVRLPPKPEYRAPTSDNLLLDQVVASSRGWLEEDEGWSTTKETPAIQDLQNPPPKSIRAPLFPEEGEGWATTRETLWPRRNEPTVRANQLQNSMFKTTPLWSQEGQGWATSREELLPSPIESNVNDAQYARSHKTSHAGNANRYPNYGD